MHNQYFPTDEENQASLSYHDLFYNMAQNLVTVDVQLVNTGLWLGWHAKPGTFEYALKEGGVLYRSRQSSRKYFERFENK